MTGPEQGFLLLTSHLGDPQRKVLTIPLLRDLTMRVRQLESSDPDRDMTVQDLLSIGYSRSTAQRILTLMADREQLQWYLHTAQRYGCQPITRISEHYPKGLLRLGAERPGCLWAKGDLSLLNTPAISLVGSRELSPFNREFARETGRQAALQGFTLVSGNARGADLTAQEACLEAGGRVISVVADRLDSHYSREGVLYLAEDGFDLAFSPIRALSRNRVIHAMGCVCLVAQCALGTGGTWDGTTKNLRHGWSPVCCFDDGSPAFKELACRGAQLIGISQLADLPTLTVSEQNFIDQ